MMVIKIIKEAINDAYNDALYDIKIKRVKKYKYTIFKLINLSYIYDIFYINTYRKMIKIYNKN